MSEQIFARLSPRELQVARKLALGATNREVAEGIGISVKTVDSHRMNLLKKLKLRNNVELALAAVASGTIEITEFSRLGTDVRE